MPGKQSHAPRQITGDRDRVSRTHTIQHRQHILARGTQSYTDADFPSPAAHHVRHRAIQSNDREQGSEEAERSGQHRDHALDEQRLVSLRVERLDVEERQFRVETRGLAARAIDLPAPYGVPSTRATYSAGLAVRRKWAWPPPSS